MLGGPAELASESLPQLYATRRRLMGRWGALVENGLAEIVEREGRLAVAILHWRPMAARALALAPAERHELAERIAAPMRSEAPQAPLDIGLVRTCRPRESGYRAGRRGRWQGAGRIGDARRKAREFQDRFRDVQGKRTMISAMNAIRPLLGLTAALMALLAVSFAQQEPVPQRRVVLVQIDGAIGPPAARHVHDAIEEPKKAAPRRSFCRSIRPAASRPACAT